MGQGELYAWYRSQTLDTLRSQLDAATIERLMAEGTQLDEEAVCALTLEKTDQARESPESLQLVSPAPDRAS